MLKEPPLKVVAFPHAAYVLDVESHEPTNAEGAAWAAMPFFSGPDQILP